MLGHIEFINKDLNTRFTLSTEGEFTGGFAKWPNHHPGERDKERDREREKL